MQPRRHWVSEHFMLRISPLSPQHDSSQGDHAMTDPQAASDLPPNLAQPARRALANAGYLRLEQLAGVDEAAIKRLHGIGPNALHQLRHALAERGLAFAAERNE